MVLASIITVRMTRETQNAHVYMETRRPRCDLAASG